MFAYDLCQQLRAEGCPSPLRHSLDCVALVPAQCHESPRSCCDADRAACSSRSRSPAGWGRPGPDDAPSPPCKPAKAVIMIGGDDGHATAASALCGIPHLKPGKLSCRVRLPTALLSLPQSSAGPLTTVSTSWTCGRHGQLMHAAAARNPHVACYHI